MTKYFRAPTVGLQDRGQDPNGRGLPGSVRTQEPEDGTLRNLEVDSPQGHELAVTLDQPFNQDRGSFIVARHSHISRETTN